MINKIKDMRIGSTVRTDNNMPYHTGYIKFICPSMINIVIGWLENDPNYFKTEGVIMVKMVLDEDYVKILDKLAEGKGLIPMKELIKLKEIAEGKRQPLLYVNELVGHIFTPQELQQEMDDYVSDKLILDMGANMSTSKAGLLIPKGL